MIYALMTSPPPSLLWLSTWSPHKSSPVVHCAAKLRIRFIATTYALLPTFPVGIARFVCIWSASSRAGASPALGLAAHAKSLRNVSRFGAAFGPSDQPLALASASRGSSDWRRGGRTACSPVKHAGYSQHLAAVPPRHIVSTRPTSAHTGCGRLGCDTKLHM